MATFSMGQRVRMLPTIDNDWGDEGTVTGFYYGPWDAPRFEGYCVMVKADHHRSGDPRWDNDWCCHPRDLAPLTDPKAERFIESIKKLKPYEEPKVVTKPAVHTD